MHWCQNHKTMLSFSGAERCFLDLLKYAIINKRVQAINDFSTDEGYLGLPKQHHHIYTNKSKRSCLPLLLYCFSYQAGLHYMIGSRSSLNSMKDLFKCLSTLIFQLRPLNSKLSLTWCNICWATYQDLRHMLHLKMVRTLPCPTYSRWTLPESRWFSRVHLQSGCIFFSWEHSQIGMHNPPGFNQDSRGTSDEPHRVSVQIAMWILPGLSSRSIHKEFRKRRNNLI